MKNLINNVSMKLAFKALMANGTTNNLTLKVGGNVLTIGEINFKDANENSKVNFSFSKEAGGNIEVSGSHDYKLSVKNLSILGSKGEEFSVETLEFNCLTEAMELFASILK